MNTDDRILFEKYFNVKESSIDYFDLILNILLNSKEFDNSEVTLLSLNVDELSENTFSFSAIYCFKTYENRCMYGRVEIYKDKFFIFSNIFKIKEAKEIEYGEMFVNQDNDNIYRFTSYGSSTYYRNLIIKELFNKADYFKVEALKQIKVRGK